jgi:hypothetical protein
MSIAVDVGVAPGQLGQRVAFELEPQVEAVGALQVVEAVAVLQAFQLLLEHEVEGRPEQAAEDRLALGEAADPEVDVVEAAGRAGANMNAPFAGNQRRPLRRLAGERRRVA